MVKLARILRDYRDAGSLNTLLALWGFVDERTFLTKAGHLGVAYRLRGVDCEAQTHGQRRVLAHRFESALRLLDEHCRVYQYVIKRAIDPIISAPCAQPVADEAIQRRTAYLNERLHELYDLTSYLVLLYEAPTTPRTSTRLRHVWSAPKNALLSWLSLDHTLNVLQGEVDRAVAALQHKASALEVQLSEFGPQRLEKGDAFRLFRHLVNYDPATVGASRLTYDTHLDYFVADS